MKHGELLLSYTYFMIYCYFGLVQIRCDQIWLNDICFIVEMIKPLQCMQSSTDPKDSMVSQDLRMSFSLSNKGASNFNVLCI